MNATIKKQFACLALGGACFAPSALNASINFTGGQGDLTFFYERAEDRWDFVFRQKGGTQATGLDNAYGIFPGIVGHSSSDFTFNSLRVEMRGLVTQEVNGTDYFILSANGSSIYPSGAANLADLGIRTRLRENEVVLENGTNTAAPQFDNLRLTLNTGLSTFASPTAEFALFGWDGFGSPAAIRYETATDDLSSDWPAWDHSHWHWGFSELGEYTLVFDVEGIGGKYGDVASPGQVAVTFAVPEPGAFAALAGVFALGAVFVRRRARR